MCGWSFGEQHKTFRRDLSWQSTLYVDSRNKDFCSPVPHYERLFPRFGGWGRPPPPHPDRLNYFWIFQQSFCHNQGHWFPLKKFSSNIPYLKGDCFHSDRNKIKVSWTFHTTIHFIRQRLNWQLQSVMFHFHLDWTLQKCLFVLSGTVALQIVTNQPVVIVCSLPKKAKISRKIVCLDAVT